MTRGKKSILIIGLPGDSNPSVEAETMTHHPVEPN